MIMYETSKILWVWKNFFQVWISLYTPRSLLWITQDIISCLDQLEMLCSLLRIVQVFICRFQKGNRCQQASLIIRVSLTAPLVYRKKEKVESEKFRNDLIQVLNHLCLHQNKMDVVHCTDCKSHWDNVTEGYKDKKQFVLMIYLKN